MKQNIFSTTVLLYLTVTMLYACKSKEAELTKRSIITGKETELVKQKVSSSGGIVSVNAPGDPLNGLRIEIPGGAYGDNRSYKISSAPIEDHELGKYFNPITPLIIISNGGGMARTSFKLTIPASTPAGEFSMPFLYDPATGELEAMMIIASDEKQITVMLNNFSHSTKETTVLAAAYAGNEEGEDVDYSQIVVSSIKEEYLMGRHLSGFKPGADDWQFTNWGSSIAPGGHCSGQSISMMWYYSKKKLKGNPSLYGQFDNDGNRKTPQLWEDDAKGYRLCSVLQNEWNYSGDNKTLMTWQGLDDARTFKSFAYALMQTNLPQLIVIFPLDNSTAHAMVVYAMEDGTLFIADPNYPGDITRRIEFDTLNKRYKPYSYFDHASRTGIVFPVFNYLAKSSVNSWRSAPNHWKQFENGSIGKAEFPGHSLVAMNTTGDLVQLTDGFKVPSGGRLTVLVYPTSLKASYRAVDDQGRTLMREGEASKLSPGDQLVGVHISDSNGRWLGFEWINVKVDKEQIVDEGPNMGDGILKLTAGGTEMSCSEPGKRNSFDLRTGDNYSKILVIIGRCSGDGSVLIRVDNFKGVGVYPVHEVSRWYINTETWEQASGKLTVKKWSKNDRYISSDDTFYCEFDFTVKNTAGESKSITGSFNAVYK